jgi:superfamily II DNA or RNA helicase
MKAVDLKASEQSRIILATFAMAKEGLDIKSLTTLLLATSQTDVTQAVGRILRVKHAQPIVVDVLDQHDLFQNQWRQRKRFYKKCNYRIEQTDSHKYPEGWTTAFHPKSADCSKDKKPKCLVRYVDE